MLFAAGLLLLNFRTQAQYAHVKPLVIRIDEVGRAEAVSYDATAYRPQDPELRYFLTRFVAMHFSRLRATVQRDYPNSLFFLDPALADATINQNEQTRVLETFLTNPTDDEVDVDVKNVTFIELKTSPFKAAVDFTKRYVRAGTRQERRQETFVAPDRFRASRRGPECLCTGESARIADHLFPRGPGLSMSRVAAIWGPEPAGETAVRSGAVETPDVSTDPSTKES